ncbi:hypothetical protein MRY87_00890 [bacterium]|nr:hypothetical protein [bacterium]
MRASQKTFFSIQVVIFIFGYLLFCVAVASADPFAAVFLEMKGEVRKGGGYLFESDAQLVPVEGVFQMVPGAEENTFAWGTSLPPGSDPTRLLVVAELSNGERQFFDFAEGEFLFLEEANADEIRSRIALLREGVGEADEELLNLQKTLERLQRDAELIGRVEQLQELSRRQVVEEREVERLVAQTEQVKESLRSIAEWTPPPDISERKQQLAKDIHELQALQAE